MPPVLTPHQRQYCAWQLTRRTAGDSVESLASTLVDSQVDLKGQFQIDDKLGSEQPEYVSDFVVETDAMILMVETKARNDIDTPEVQAKAAAASRWCKHASDHATSVGSKPWRYLLVPHDDVAESKRLTDFLRFGVKLELTS